MSDSVSLEEVDPVRALIMSLIKEHNSNLAEISRSIGKNHAYLQQFLRRGTPRTLPEDVREELGRIFNLPAEGFRTGRLPPSYRDKLGAAIQPFVVAEDGGMGGMSAGESGLDKGIGAILGPSHLERIPPKDLAATHPAKKQGGSQALKSPDGTSWLLLPWLEVEQGVNGPSGIKRAETRPPLAFQRVWIEKTLQVAPERLAVLIIQGRNMEPELRPGDMVLVDKDSTKVTLAGLFVRQIGQGLQVVRCQRLGDGRIRISHADTSLSDEYANPDSLSKLNLIGEIVWSGSVCR